MGQEGLAKLENVVGDANVLHQKQIIVASQK